MECPSVPLSGSVADATKFIVSLVKYLYIKLLFLNVVVRPDLACK